MDSYAGGRVGGLWPLHAAALWNSWHLLLSTGEDNGDIKAGSWIQLIISIITPSEKLPDHSPVRLKSPQTAPYFWPSLKMKKKQRQTMCMPHLWKGHKKQIQPHAASVQNINGSGVVLTHWITVRIEQQVGVEITQLSTFPVPLKKKNPLQLL